MKPMRERLIELMKENLPGVDVENETALVDDGILESLDLVTLVNEIMNEFDMELNVDDLVPENFNSVDSILEMIEDKQV